jgi:hypothetical protein
MARALLAVIPSLARKAEYPAATSCCYLGFLTVIAIALKI